MNSKRTFMMARLIFILFIAGLFLIGRSSGSALNHAEENKGTEVPPPHLQANSNSSYNYLGRLLLDIENTWCAFIKDNQKLVKDVLSVYFQHLNEFLCHNSSETTSAFKNAFLTYSGLVKDPESENARLVWSTFERLRNMWCEFANNESLISEHVLPKLNFTNLNWESIFKELPNDLLKLKQLLLGLEHNVSKRSPENTLLPTLGMNWVRETLMLNKDGSIWKGFEQYSNMKLDAAMDAILADDAADFINVSDFRKLFSKENGNNKTREPFEIAQLIAVAAAQAIKSIQKEYPLDPDDMYYQLSKNEQAEKKRVGFKYCFFYPFLIIMKTNRQLLKDTTALIKSRLLEPTSLFIWEEINVPKVYCITPIAKRAVNLLVTSNNTTWDNRHSQNLKSVKRDAKSIPNSAKMDFFKFFTITMEQLGKQLHKYESEGKESFDEDITLFNVSVNNKLEGILRSCSLSNTSASDPMKGCNNTVTLESAGIILVSSAVHIGLELEHSKFPTDYNTMSREQQAKEKLRVLKAFYKAVSMMDKDKLFECVYNFITKDIMSPDKTFRDLLEYLVECLKEKAMKPEFYKGEKTFAHAGHHHRHAASRLRRGLHQDFLFMNRLVKKVKRSANDRPMSKEEWKAKKEQFFRNQMFGQENIDPHNESLTDIEKNVKGILDGFAIESGSGDKPTTLKMSKKWKPVVQRIRRASGENLTDEVGSSEDEERLSLSQDEKIVLEEALDRIISAIINHRNELMSRTRKFISLVVHILAKSEKMEPEALSCIARAGVTFMSETRKHLNTVFKGFRSELETMKKTLWSEDSVDGSDKDETITKLISAELMRDVEDAIAASSRTYEVNKVRLFEKFMICKAKNSI
ncbi:uncharacterized protein LOC106667194 isoform X2 [Cimex lectularius]|uniref:Uncharacterized protein n=1 Tax=Cimex lectularius TaxID=79782 RepID=A0A8I6TEU1_CIMLE|nr:uncharacterized protein LOC106667194 isoform X2 [Cimex lectularius]